MNNTHDLQEQCTQAIKSKAFGETLDHIKSQAVDRANAQLPTVPGHHISEKAWQVQTFTITATGTYSSAGKGSGGGSIGVGITFGRKP